MRNNVLQAYRVVTSGFLSCDVVVRLHGSTKTFRSLIASIVLFGKRWARKEKSTQQTSLLPKAWGLSRKAYSRSFSYTYKIAPNLGHNLPSEKDVRPMGRAHLPA